ncbi:MAG: hypothetical protein M3Q07_27635 [Pseudobdellovibrionaceae bacterium]|nr:hypothetical protein [Pseudobdellovibrionaceae bacterium]
MADPDYLNGIRVVKGGDEVRIILTPNQAVVGVVGTAPKASEAVLPAETPVVFFKKKDALDAILPDPKQATKEEEKGTLHASVEAIFNQRTRTVIVVRSKSESTDNLLKAIEKLLEAEALTNYKPKILCAPGHTAQIPTDVPTPTPVPTPENDPVPTPENDPVPTPLRSTRNAAIPMNMKVKVNA